MIYESTVPNVRATLFLFYHVKMFCTWCIILGTGKRIKTRNNDAGSERDFQAKSYDKNSKVNQVPCPGDQEEIPSYRCEIKSCMGMYACNLSSLDTDVGRSRV